MKVAVTGATGRLGGALLTALAAMTRRAPWIEVEPWGRPSFDLDRPESFAELLAVAGPDIVLNTAAWTDVDACVREPELAMARNGSAVGALAEACASAGAALIHVSTNEVFPGDRTDGVGYREDDPTQPSSPYGASKLAGEEAARAVGPRRTWIMRTSWLFGAPGDDFPVKVLRAADRALRTDTPLRLVEDEVGCPTYADDLALALLELAGLGGRPGYLPGTYHVAGTGSVSRAGWAERVLSALEIEVPIEHVTLDAWERPSTPPRWAVLDCGKAVASGIALRAWEAATDAELPRYRALWEELHRGG